jgi:FkbM family methyltransferase
MARAGGPVVSDPRGAPMTIRPTPIPAASDLPNPGSRHPASLNRRATRTVKKLLRTVQIRFPGLLDAKFAVMRSYRLMLRKPFEADFKALVYFRAMAGEYLDVGANRGQSTDAIRMHLPDAHVHLFEPNGLLFRKLQWMFRTDTRLTLHNVGLGDQSVTAPLNVPVYSNWMFDGLGSFDRDEAKDWLRNRMYFYDERQLRIEAMTCQIVPLDTLNLTPCFIKLDIQGYELKALQGGERTLRRCEPVLLTESPDDATLEYLSGLGYQFFAYDGRRFIERAVGAPNTFFMTPSRARHVAHLVEHRTGDILRF